MKVLKILLTAVAFMVLAFFGIGLMLPSQASLSRQVEIAAPPQAVFAVLNSFARFNEWSPWAALDPETRYALEGPASGVGAVHSWSSDNPQVGSGRQEIIASEPYRLITVRLSFSGFDAENLSHYRLSPTATGTEVVWDYQTDVGGQILGRYFLLMLDGMLGPQYEQGLAQLKQVLEAPAEG